MHYQREKEVAYFAKSKRWINLLLSEFKINYPEYSRYTKAIEKLQIHGERKTIYYHKAKDNVIKGSVLEILKDIKIFGKNEKKQTTYENFIKLLDILKKDTNLNFILSYNIRSHDEDKYNYKKDYIDIYFNMGFYGKK